MNSRGRNSKDTGPGPTAPRLKHGRVYGAEGTGSCEPASRLGGSVCLRAWAQCLAIHLALSFSG